MNAVASGLIEAIKYAFGADPNTYPPGSAATGTDWDLVPTGAKSWYKYGGGGVNSWGSLCGVPNAAIAVLNLMDLHGTFAEQIMYYVCQTEFPCRGLHDLFLDSTYGWDTTFAPEPMPDDEVLAYTVSNSPLCHASVSKWAYAAGINMSATTPYATAHKTDRCAKVCADVTAFTASLLNGAISNLTMPELTASCYSCHQTGSTHSPAQQGKMDCVECHQPGTYHVPNKIVIENVWTEDGAGNAKDTYTAGDSIVAKVRFAVLGAGSAYVKTFESKVKGPCGKILACKKAETLMGGVYTWSWSGTVPSGCAGKAKIIMELKSYHYEGSAIISDVIEQHGFTIA